MKCFCHLNGLAVKDATARREIEDLKQTMSDMTGSIQTLRDEVESVEKDIINTNKALATTNSNIIEISKAINSMLAIINNLTADLSKLETRVYTLEEDNTSGGGDTGGDSGEDSGGESGGNDPIVNKLTAPTISLIGDTLNITDHSGGKADTFKIYVNDELKGTTTTDQYPINMIVDYGTYTVKVKASASGYTDSDFSNSVIYTLSRPKLEAPTITLSGNSLYIKDNSDVATSYDLYKNGTLLATIMSTTAYLPTYIGTDGVYTITAKANATGYTTSDASNSVTYHKVTVDTRKTIAGKWLVNEAPYISADLYEDGLNESFDTSVIVGGVATIEGIEIVAGENFIYYYEDASGNNEVAYDSNTEKWYCIPEILDNVGNRPALSRQLDFGSGIKVSVEFYNWFTANADTVSEFPVVEEEEEEEEETPTSNVITPGLWVDNGCDRDETGEAIYVEGYNESTNIWYSKLQNSGATLPCRINFEEGGVSSCDFSLNFENYICYGITFESDGRVTFNLEDQENIEAWCDFEDGNEIWVTIDEEIYPNGIELTENEAKCWNAVFHKFVAPED